MSNQILNVKRLSVFSDHAKLVNIGFSIARGECLALAVPDQEERRLLLRALVGDVPLTDGVLALNGHSIEEEAPYVRLNSGMSLFLPKKEDSQIFSDERIFGLNLLGYRRFFPSFSRWRFPWLGDRRGLRRLKRTHRIYTQASQKPSLIVYYDPNIEDETLAREFHKSLAEFRKRGGALLVISHAFREERGMDRAGLIAEGRMLGIVENHKEEVQRLWAMGGTMNNA